MAKAGASLALRQRVKGRPAEEGAATADVAADDGHDRRPAAPPAPWWGLPDLWISLAFLGVALYSRLVNISDPPSLVFDEEHFTKFSTWYITGHYYVGQCTAWTRGCQRAHLLRWVFDATQQCLPAEDITHRRLLTVTHAQIFTPRSPSSPSRLCCGGTGLWARKR